MVCRKRVACFPVGERFFIASVRNYRDRITDPELKQAVVAFIGQEAMHGREHERYNRLLQNSGMPVADMEQLVDRVLGFARKFLPRSWQLATTLALEHQTAIIADLLLTQPDLLAGSDPAFRRLWQWHSLEETEHKAVAYDVWNEGVGSGRVAYVVRGATMLFTALTFWTLVGTFSVRMIETDPATRRRPRGYLDLATFLFGRQGMFRASLPVWRSYFKRSFHPWHHDNRQLLEQIDAVIRRTFKRRSMNLLKEKSASGLEQLRAWITGKRQPPIGETMQFALVEACEGRVVFEGTPGQHVYNPIGAVHGGYAATLLDSACGCAVHSSLGADQASAVAVWRPIQRWRWRTSIQRYERTLQRHSANSWRCSHAQSDGGSPKAIYDRINRQVRWRSFSSPALAVSECWKRPA